MDRKPQGGEKKKKVGAKLMSNTVSIKGTRSRNNQRGEEREEKERE